MFTGVAFITGAASGIGQATGQSFARKGIKRIVLVDLGDLSAPISLLKGVETLSVQADVSDEAQVKAAIGRSYVAFERQACIDHGAEGVRINTVAPGLVETPMMAGDEVITEDSVQDVLTARPGMLEELADLITFMFSEEASYVNGSTWSVDGGRMVH
ncbi:hypothetical protein CspHIS471_0208990 [Cutaneotrichosporon sp. HIS471]|nr:hypothetical protein CspHIS471_0208990 [Cutaneotrichosporon sp. HIS471]